MIRHLCVGYILNFCILLQVLCYYFTVRFTRKGVLRCPLDTIFIFISALHETDVRHSYTAVTMYTRRHKFLAHVTYILPHNEPRTAARRLPYIYTRFLRDT